MSSSDSLYSRLGGYDGISAVVDDLIPRLIEDEQLGRFWAHRGDDGLQREEQLLVDFLCHASGGPMYYTGRSMTLAHRGMRISESDWDRFVSHVQSTLAAFEVSTDERADVLAFIASTKDEIVEAE